MERDQLHGFLPLGRDQRHDRFQNRRSQGESKHRDECDHQRGKFRMVKRKLHGFLSLEHNQFHSEQQDLGGQFRRKLGNEYDHQRGKLCVVKREFYRFLSMGKHPEHDQQQTEQRKVYRFQLNEWNHLHHEFRTQLRTQHSIYSTISSKMSAARDAVGNAISALKSKFNFSWSLPHLKLPHVSISGSFSINPPSVPHFGISWYKDGGILTRPTIFGAAGNNLLAGGEAGAEAVVPLATLWDKLETMITSVFNTASTTGGSSGEGLTSTAGRLLTLDDFSLGSLADSGGVVVHYDFSGFTWSPQIQTEGTGDDADDFMAKLKAHEAEFFDWLEEFIKMREVAQYA